jgi:uncharacterized membrane protein YccF (DUF307 family)
VRTCISDATAEPRRTKCIREAAPSGDTPIFTEDTRAMRVILNIIWLLFAGIWMAIAYVVAGIICCILIITIPFGIASFRIAAYALWPFGRTVVRRSDAGVASAVGNVIWLIVAGIWLALGHVGTGILLCVTIIGIPLGIASFKMVPISLLPLGREIVPVDAAYARPY